MYNKLEDLLLSENADYTFFRFYYYFRFFIFLDPL